MNNELSPFKAVFFDLGYTLIYFSSDFYERSLESYLVLANHLLNAGCKIDPTAFVAEFDQKIQRYYRQRDLDFLERPIESIIKEILTEHKQAVIPNEEYERAVQAMYLTTEKYWLIEEDTYETLQWLSDHRFRLGLISNAASAWDVNNLIDNHRLRPYFSTILISASEGIRKPNPVIFRQAAQNLGIGISEAVMVGDLPDADVLGAHRAGMPAIWISRHKEKDRDCVYTDPGMRPDAEIRALKELPVLLTNWDHK